jgi:hypothetical protein
LGGGKVDGVEEEDFVKGGVVENDELESKMSDWIQVGDLIVEFAALELQHFDGLEALVLCEELILGVNLMKDALDVLVSRSSFQADGLIAVSNIDIQILR